VCKPEPARTRSVRPRLGRLATRTTVLESEAQPRATGLPRRLAKQRQQCFLQNLFSSRSWTAISMKREKQPNIITLTQLKYILKKKLRVYFVYLSPNTRFSYAMPAPLFEFLGAYGEHIYPMCSISYIIYKFRGCNFSSLVDMAYLYLCIR
jgi:hypothetical protein